MTVTTDVQNYVDNATKEGLEVAEAAVALQPPGLAKVVEGIVLTLTQDEYAALIKILNTGIGDTINILDKVYVDVINKIKKIL